MEVVLFKLGVGEEEEMEMENGAGEQLTRMKMKTEKHASDQISDSS